MKKHATHLPALRPLPVLRGRSPGLRTGEAFEARECLEYLASRPFQTIVSRFRRAGSSAFPAAGFSGAAACLLRGSGSPLGRPPAGLG